MTKDHLKEHLKEVFFFNARENETKHVDGFVASRHFALVVSSSSSRKLRASNFVREPIIKIRA